ncbi:hypothetical protein ACLBKU_09740 [Erythrobacter sp. NE805]|uniref:hypothetical protein n=1 Tax=Erythrobacter sp. NE805 TaxID=3389875 RepID=UPI00396B0FEE
MSENLTILAAVVAAFVLIIAIIRISMWATSRKPTSSFKKERPDATESNSGGYSV